MPAILITGAAGRTSGFVIRALLQAPSPIQPSDLRLLVRSQDSAHTLQSRIPALADAHFVVGDYLEAHTLAPAVAGVDVVFHNGPAFHPLESAMGIALIEAARAAGVRHFVYCSVLFPVLTKMVNHKAKAVVEEHLIESGLEYTILQPSSLMQNINLQTVVSTGTLLALYTPSVLQGYLDLEDLGLVARTVILDPAAHSRARYELVGENCSYEDVARAIGAQLGKDTKVVRLPREEATSRSGLHVDLKAEHISDGFHRMLFYYDRRGIPGNNNTVRWILGREPTSWAERIRRDLERNAP
ncbi:NAD(P)-binding protein [Lenzites betulinus]|nr:NAD(P)-binding protein [Lenzites betulinus]